MSVTLSSEGLQHGHQGVMIPLAVASIICDYQTRAGNIAMPRKIFVAVSIYLCGTNLYDFELTRKMCILQLFFKMAVCILSGGQRCILLLEVVKNLKSCTLHNIPLKKTHRQQR